MKVNIYDKNSKAQGELELDSMFDAPINETLLHQVILAKLADAREGNACTKGRSEVAGSTIKLFKQKGTGRARQGSAKAPHLYGGGIAFGPKPRSYKQKVNKKMQKAALIHAVSSKVQNNNLIVVDDLNFEEIKTKNIVNLLKSFNIDSCLFVDNSNEKLNLSSRNIYKVKALKPEQLNSYDVIRYEKMIITKAALDKFTNLV